MNLWERRPLCVALLAFLAATVLCAFAPAAVKVAGGLLFAALFAAAWLRRCRRGTLRLSYLLCSFALAVACFSSYLGLDRQMNRLGKESALLSVTVRVEEITYQNAALTYLYGTITEADGAPCRVRAAFDLKGPGGMAVGDVFTAEAVVQPIDQSDELRSYYYARGYFYQATVEGSLSVTGQQHTLTHRLTALRQRASSVLTDAVEGEAGAFMSALLLGERHLLDGQTPLSFRRLGISHMLALSGLHLTTLTMGLHLLLRRLRLPKGGMLILTALFVLFYMALTGFSFSILRSGIMSLLLILSFLFAKRADSLTSLLVAATLICLLSPYAVYDWGFWLSAAAAFGILIGTMAFPLPTKPKRLGGKLFGYFLLYPFAITSFAACLTLPVVAVAFGEFSLFSLPANLLLAPLVQWYLLDALLVLLLAPVPYLGVLPAWVGQWSGELILRLIRELASVPGILIRIDFPETVGLLFAGLVLIFLYVSLPRFPNRRLALYGMVLLAALSLSLGVRALVRHGQSAVVYHEEKEASFLLVNEHGRLHVLDLSDGSKQTAYAASDAVRQSGVCEIERYILTHYRMNTGAMLAKLFAGRKVFELYLPIPESADAVFAAASVVAAAEAAGVRYVYYEDFEAIPLGDTTLHILSGKPGLVLVRCGQTELVYVGRGFDFGRSVPGQVLLTGAEVVIFGAVGAAGPPPPAVPLPSLHTVLLADKQVLPYEPFLSAQDERVSVIYRPTRYVVRAKP
ncbi:MAG: ComEC/Rec2 family competence protein [Eubacteriales bacterium]